MLVNVEMEDSCSVIFLTLLDVLFILLTFLCFILFERDTFVCQGVILLLDLFWLYFVSFSSQFSSHCSVRPSSWPHELFFYVEFDFPTLIRDWNIIVLVYDEIIKLFHDFERLSINQKSFSQFKLVKFTDFFEFMFLEPLIIEVYLCRAISSDVAPPYILWNKVDWIRGLTLSYSL
jgi:hypothetical protein